MLLWLVQLLLVWLVHLHSRWLLLYSVIHWNHQFDHDFLAPHHSESCHLGISLCLTTSSHIDDVLLRSLQPRQEIIQFDSLLLYSRR
jgi:hypothetical protein